MSSPRAIAILVGVIFIGACTTLRNTPQQDLVWSAYNQCKAEGRIPTNVQFVRVEPDGRAWSATYSSAYGAQELERCITEKTSSGSAGITPPVNAAILSPAVSCPANPDLNAEDCTSP